MTKSASELELFEPILEELKGPYASEALINVFINNLGLQEEPFTWLCEKIFQKDKDRPGY